MAYIRCSLYSGAAPGPTIPDGSTVTPTDDVQTLLNCADIWDKAYTTISQLLADTTSLLAVITDNNAVDYLVRSTTWASAVTGDSTAMTDIGADNYASNTLLANATWCTAICNSTYFESVLNVKVPTMTSNTTPSGECFANSLYPSSSNYPWWAFNGNESDEGWRGSQTSSATNIYLGYTFTNSVKCYMATIVWDSSNITNVQYKYQSSSDQFSSDVHDVSSTETTFAGKIKTIFNTYLHKDSYRLFIISQSTAGSTYNVGRVKELQFYGRSDV